MRQFLKAFCSSMAAGVAGLSGCATFVTGVTAKSSIIPIVACSTAACQAEKWMTIERCHILSTTTTRNKNFYTLAPDSFPIITFPDSTNSQRRGTAATARTFGPLKKG